ncbi:hypothetical protein P8C59_005902 [Phyllachora maydis]|uniref:Kynurenine formamidase n=1 Tax=Phyllachora maydis TaxID=1825666 RepID=A0AAD9I6J9_9PEZI|nr:hypothetical protein P8C59_005902 [Phyllachora maydis]
MTTAQDIALWTSIAWTAVADANDGLIGWHKQSVPYVGCGTTLQTVDVWIALALASSSSGPSAPPPPAWIPAAVLPTPPLGRRRRRRGRPWAAYIHGGAWRDPRITAASLAPTAHALLRRAATSAFPLGGLASVNYRLSPHPHRLGLLGGGGAPWALVGHSCGATLAWQSVMDAGARWGLHGGEAAELQQPDAVVGLNGVYDLAGFVARPPASHAGLRRVYAEFATGAFGPDEAVWRAACPATAEGMWVDEWRADGAEGKRAVLAQSREDTLVPYEQLEGLREVLGRKAPWLDLRVVEARGDHDEMWERGTMADILMPVLEDLV